MALKREQLEKLKTAAEEKISSIEEKENPTDYDEELKGALESLVSAIDEVTNVLDSKE